MLLPHPNPQAPDVIYFLHNKTKYHISNDTRVSLDYMVFISIMRTLCNVRCLCLNPFFCIVFFYCIHDTTCTTEKLFKKFVICYDTFIVNVGGYLLPIKCFYICI